LAPGLTTRLFRRRGVHSFVGPAPYQALATATRNSTVYFGTLDSTDTIAVGKRADLVLLSGDPLADIRMWRIRTA